MANTQVYIGFDFSMNKPAATVYCNRRFYFFLWMLKMSEKHLLLYSDAGVRAMSRGLESIEKPKGKTKAEDNSKLVLIHTIRSTDLANTIIESLDNLIYQELGCKDGEYDLYVCSEGLSMASKGDATLDLATYKGVLLSKIYEHYGDNLCRLFTYSPPTLKATAGCSKKELQKDKRNMIMAFGREPIDAPLLRAINDGSLILKTNFVDGVDDISDSYWALRTMIKKEKLQFP